MPTVVGPSWVWPAFSPVVGFFFVFGFFFKSVVGLIPDPVPIGIARRPPIALVAVGDLLSATLIADSRSHLLFIVVGYCSLWAMGVAVVSTAIFIYLLLLVIAGDNTLCGRSYFN